MASAAAKPAATAGGDQASSSAVTRRLSSVDEPKAGELRKRSNHLGVYRRKNVVLTAVGMQIYDLNQSDKAQSVVPITADTVVSDIKIETVRGNHGSPHPNQAIFQVISNENMSVNHSYRPRIFGTGYEEHWFSAPTLESAQSWKHAIEERAKSLAESRSNIVHGQEVRADMDSTTGARDTASTATATSDAPKKEHPPRKVSIRDENPTAGSSKPKILIVSGESLTLSKDEKTRNLRERLKKTQSQRMGNLPKPISKTINLIQQAQWKEVLVTNGLRIMSEIALTRENPCLRVSCVLPASTKRAFKLYYDFDRRSQWDGLTESVEVLNEDDDGHLRTVHCKLRGQKVGGVSVAPRDYVVDSTWRHDDDGSIVILETNSSQKVPPTPGYVRAEIFAIGMTLCPRRRKAGDQSPVASASTRKMNLNDEATDKDDDGDEDCLLQMAVHVNVGGWLAKMPIDWGQHWLFAFMTRVVGFRSILEEDNYESVDFNTFTASSMTPVNKQKSLKPFPASLLESELPSKSDDASQPVEAQREKIIASGATAIAAEALKVPAVQGTLSKEYVFPCEEPWNLRSSSYLVDKKKEPSAGAMFDLIGMDLYEVDEPIDNMAQNMKGTLADKYLSTNGPKPYLFIVQFQVPGPPNLSFIAYFAAKPGAIETISPFSRLFADFIDGTDQYRDGRFKFIPRVVKGSYVVKSAVGQTPTLIGNKLVTSYHKGDGYFEIDIDVGSSSVAGGVLRIVKGYLSSLMIDMCFLFEAQSDEELPEVVLGSLRFEKLSLDMAKKWTPPK